MGGIITQAGSEDEVKGSRIVNEVEWNSSSQIFTEHFLCGRLCARTHVEHNYEKTSALPINCLKSNEAELCKQFTLIQALNDQLKGKEKNWH